MLFKVVQNCLLLTLLLFNFSSLRAYFKSEHERTQQEIVSYLNTIPASSETDYDPTKLVGLLSSALSIYSSGPIVNFQKEREFKNYFVTTQEGRQSLAMAKIWPGEARPTVVFVSGLGSITSRAFLNLALPIERYLGWNVILLENVSSNIWVKRNQTILTSGYEAGWDLFLKIKALRSDKNIDRSISELHAVGVSLGGNDLSYALYFNSILGGQIIDGAALNWSSPANRYEGFKRIRAKRGISGLVVTKMMKQCFEPEVYGRYTTKSFSEIYRDDGSNNYDDILQTVFSRPIENYFMNQTHHFEKMISGESKIKLAQTKNLSLSDIKTLYTLDKYITNIKNPLLWIHAKNDPIVDLDLSENYIYSLPLNSKIGTLVKNYGGHIGFPHAYGGEWTIEMMVNYFEYWGKYPKSYYEQWRSAYQFDKDSPRYLRGENSSPTLLF